jgi:hypothetical protein
MTLTIVQETNTFPVHDGYVWQECWVRTPEGRVELYDIPLRPFGSNR